MALLGFPSCICKEASMVPRAGRTASNSADIKNKIRLVAKFTNDLVQKTRTLALPAGLQHCTTQALLLFHIIVHPSVFPQDEFLRTFMQGRIRHKFGPLHPKAFF